MGMDAIPISMVRAKIVTDHTGQAVELPVLVGRDGVFKPMVQYQWLFADNSLSWHLQLCHAVRLLLEYAAANAGAFGEPKELFQSFSWHLDSGTLGGDALDPSGLYWFPRNASHTNNIRRTLTVFSDWLAKNYGVAPINPLRDATRHEQVIAALAWGHKNQASFLGHTQSRALAMQALKKTPWVPQRNTPTITGKKKPRFPEDKFFQLLFDGFVLHDQIADKILRLDLRCVLITLLQHGGGLRMSECFHLWIEDVQRDPDDPTVALVRIGDPKLGLAEWQDGNGKTVRGSRGQYLASRGLQPRDRVLGGIRAGWKRPTLDDKWYLQVYWRDPVYGQLFWAIWQKYLLQVIPLPRRHPWAFVNLTKHNAGEPMTMSNYRKAHRRAVERIGLRAKKSEGTEPHGHRHAYAYRLGETGVPPVVIQRVMHHKSFLSQQVYTAPERTEIHNSLMAAYKRLDDGRKLDLEQIKTSHPATLALSA